MLQFNIYKTRVSGARLGQRLLPADCTLGTTYSILVQVTNLRLGEIVQKPIHRFVIIEHNEKLYQVGELYTLEHFPCGHPLFITTFCSNLNELQSCYI